MGRVLVGKDASFSLLVDEVMMCVVMILSFLLLSFCFPSQLLLNPFVSSPFESSVVLRGVVVAPPSFLSFNPIPFIPSFSLLFSSLNFPNPNA